MFNASNSMRLVSTGGEVGGRIKTCSPTDSANRIEISPSGKRSTVQLPRLISSSLATAWAN